MKMLQTAVIHEVLFFVVFLFYYQLEFILNGLGQTLDQGAKLTQLLPNNDQAQVVQRPRQTCH